MYVHTKRTCVHTVYEYQTKYLTVSVPSSNRLLLLRGVSNSVSDR